MILENEKVRKEKLYTVGYNSNLNKYILTYVVPSMVWYNRYYEISVDEYNQFDSNPCKLDEFVDNLHTKNYASDRFLFSDMIRENSVAQAELREIAMAK